MRFRRDFLSSCSFPPKPMGNQKKIPLKPLWSFSAYFLPVHPVISVPCTALLGPPPNLTLLSFRCTCCCPRWADPSAHTHLLSLLLSSRRQLFGLGTTLCIHMLPGTRSTSPRPRSCRCNRCKHALTTGALPGHAENLHVRAPMPPPAARVLPVPGFTPTPAHRGGREEPAPAHTDVIWAQHMQEHNW